MRKDRIKGRIEVDEINAFVFDVPLQHVEVIAVVEDAAAYYGRDGGSARTPSASGAGALPCVALPAGGAPA
jgi:hypothetical protein